ncbi:MAG: hypothetical protein K7J15_00285, partial [Candidatus Regiella insecticola]|nr:hypothetical protein [Candidatus Regiella insecticola]
MDPTPGKVFLTALERNPNKPPAADEYGWSAKMSEQPVRKPYQKLVQQLGCEFDGKIAGINFSESSIDIEIENADGSTTFLSILPPKLISMRFEKICKCLQGRSKNPSRWSILILCPANGCHETTKTI